MGLVGDTFSRREVIDRLPGRAAIGHNRYSTTGETILRNVQPLFCRAGRRRLRRRPQRQPHQRPDAAQAAGARRRHHAVDQRLRGDPAPRGAVAAQPLHRPLHRRAAPARGRLFVRRADQQEADRRARPARHPPAGHRRARRPSDPGVGDLRARHHQRALRARRRERRGRGVRRGRHAIAQAVPARCSRAPASSNTSTSRGRIRSSAGARSTTCARPWARSSRAKSGVAADVIVPVPDSGVPAALGFAQEAGIPYELGIIRNHYVGRTFIEPTPADPPARRAAEAFGQPRGGERQAHRAGRRLRSCAAPRRPRSCR